MGWRERSSAEQSTTFLRTSLPSGPCPLPPCRFLGIVPQFLARLCGCLALGNSVGLPPLPAGKRPGCPDSVNGLSGDEMLTRNRSARRGFLKPPLVCYQKHRRN